MIIIVCDFRVTNITVDEVDQEVVSEVIEVSIHNNNVWLHMYE